MTHFASIMRGEKALKQSQNYHPAHLSDSCRMYLCGCAPEIYLIYPDKNVYMLNIKGKRFKPFRKIKYTNARWNMYKRSH